MPTFPFSEDEIIKEAPDDLPPAKEPPKDNDVGSGPMSKDGIRVRLLEQDLSRFQRLLRLPTLDRDADQICEALKRGEVMLRK